MAFGNCAGQNKSRMARCLDSWLVDMGIYEIVKILFLVTDHTKHVCDRIFKDIKRSCRKMDIFSIEVLVQKMNRSDKMNVHHVTYTYFSN